jgi:Major capsid protein 13-like
MAIGKASDFKIYNDQFFGGLVEQTQQDTQALGSAGITVRTRAIRGEYDYRSFISKISGLVSRRDTAAVTAATDLAVPMGEMVSVKVNRKIGPVAQTLDSWRKAALAFADAQQGDDGAQAFSRYLGAMAAKDVAVDMLDTGLIAAWKAIEQQATNVHTVAANGTMTTAALVSGLSKLGDAANRITGFVMHSKVYYDLVQAQIAANTLQVSGGVVATGTPVTLNRPVYVTDSASLLVAGTPDLYRTLALTNDGIMIENSENQELAFTLVTGLENLVHRMQGEFAYNVGLKGFRWDVANGGANPNSTAIATATNWDKVATSNKDLLGVSIVSG